MLARLEIENFRCFKKHTVPFRSTTVVVGQNNAGKSTLIEALRLIGLAQNRYRVLNYEGPPGWLDQTPVGGAGFRPSIERFDLSPEGLFHQYGEPPAKISAVFKNGTRIDLYIGPDFQLFAVPFRSKTIPVGSRSEANRVSIPDMAVLPPLGLPKDRERILVDETVRSGFGTDLASIHFRNEIQRFKNQYFAEFKALAERTWPGLQILEFSVAGRPPDTYFSLLVRDEAFAAELAWMGAGLKMWLQIMWFLVSARAKQIVVLDEPDIYMHPDLQRKMAHILRSLHSQTIITTHSVELISEVEPEDILIINKSRRESQFANSVAAVQKAVDGMGTGQNIQLMRLWTAKRFLIVEGQDVRLLSMFQGILFPNSQTPFGALPSLSIGGWGGWQRAIGSSAALKNSAGESIVTYCILDRDYQSTKSIADLMNEAKEKRIELHVWQRKELENYLLSGEAVARLINEREDEGKPKLSPDDVDKRLGVLADQLYDSTFDAISTYNLLADRASGLVNAHRAAREYLKVAWGSLEGKLSVVSGKKMLALLSAWSQENFDVSISPGAITRYMQPGDVDPEVVSVVTSIERSRPFS